MSDASIASNASLLAVRVDEIWDLALPADTRLLGGAQGLSNPVEWVAPMRASFPLFGSLGSQYLILLPLAHVQHLDERLTLSYLLSELHGASASAVVLDATLDLVHADDVALADELALPLFLLPAGSDLQAVERAILRTLVDRQGQIVRREAEVRQHLQYLFAHAGMKAVLAELARLTGGYVAVYDEGHGLVLDAGHAGSVAPEPVESCYPIHVGGRVLGSLIVRFAARRSNLLDNLYGRQAAEICGIEMLEQRARQETEERMGFDLVELLLDGESHGEAVYSRLTRLGYDTRPQRKHIVVALGLQEHACSDEKTSPGDHARDERLLSDVARELQWAAERDGATVLSRRYRGLVLLLCSLPSDLFERRVRDWLRDTVGAARRVVLEAGVSRTWRDLGGVGQAIREAISAWELGQHVGDQESPYFYEQMGLYRLLAELRGRDELQRFYRETLGPLADYDAAHDTELVRTLEAFFEQNANASQTARALYVHRNTLNYRLHRIVEITGLDLNDPKARLALQLALKIHRLC